MGLFGKKKTEDADTSDEDFNDDQFLQDEGKEQSQDKMNIPAEILKLQAQLDSMSEMRKTSGERFTRISEQIGELRGMIMDTNKSLQQMEVKVVKSVDLVENVQPDKLMIEVKRQDAKIEGQAARVETNKSLLESIMEDIKGVRRTISTFKGIEQTIKMNDDVKKELREIEKVKASVERHSDKAENLFVEIQKKVTDIDNLIAKIKDLEKGFNAITQDFDVLKIKFSNKSDKKDTENMIAKFQKFEDHYGKVVDLLAKQGDDLKVFVTNGIEDKLKEANHIRKMLLDLTHENPHLEKHLKTLKEMAHQDAEEQKEEPEEKKEGFVTKMKGIFAKKEESEKVEIPDSIGAGDDKPTA